MNGLLSKITLEKTGKKNQIKENVNGKCMHMKNLI